MAQLAIKGHATKWKEVIEILEMLGGNNEYHINITECSLLYTIREVDNVIIAIYPTGSISQIFTLEDFLKKFPYKVGDKVIAFGNKCTIIDAIWDKSINEVVYTIKLDVDGYTTTKLSNQLKTYIEETMEEEGILTIDFTKDTRIADKVEVILGDYEFVLKDGKTYFVKKKPKYPKTYEECCDVLQMPKDESYIDIDVPLSYNKVLTSFTQLLICRDAYWKIAGDWEPNFANVDEKFIIACYYGKIYTTIATNYNRVLVFPTEEMRDAFYENFKELIEECKELL